MVEESISSKNWGPIHATLYVTDFDTIIVQGTFHEDERNYPGPNYTVAKIPEKLLLIKKEHPHRYLTTNKWQQYIKDLWEIVLDNPWFRYDL